MNKYANISRFSLGGVITFLTVYLFIRLTLGQDATFVLPGWHTKIIPAETSWLLLTIFVLLVSVFVFYLHKAITLLIGFFWRK